MRTAEFLDWTNGAARARLPNEMKVKAAQWVRNTKDSPLVRRYNRHSQIKVLILFLGFFTTLYAYQAWPHPLTAVICVALNGAFFIPYTRVFMHSQMHWGLSNSRWLNYLYDHTISVLFAVTQTGYSYGHRLHHRYDNDFNAAGTPNDKQSTYIFSKSGRPCHILLWVAYYIFFYQQIYVTYLVLKSRQIKDIGFLMLEYGLIFLLHFSIFLYAEKFYMFVFLPSLLTGWIGSALTLYEMHNVSANEYHIHPTNTSTDWFFNWYGDNDGYHLEHTLFASLHPCYLKELHKVVLPSKSQVYKKQFAFEALGRLLDFKERKSGKHEYN